MLKILAFYCLSLWAMVSPGDMAMIQVAQNTLSSVRNLKEIIQGQKEFSQAFEKVHAKVQTKIWQANRAIMWLEDMKALGEVEIKSLNDFNYVLASLKESKKSLERSLIHWELESRKSQQAQKKANQMAKRALRRKRSYSANRLSHLSPHTSQIETAKNTQDILMEVTEMNRSQLKVEGQLLKLTEGLANENQRRIAKKYREKKQLHQVERGILTPELLRVQ